MKKHIRLALPPLAQLSEQSDIPFVVIDKDGGVLRSGALAFGQLGVERAAGPVYVVLSPGDAVTAQVNMPPLSGRRLDAAVINSVEPMSLSDVTTLCIAHGPRDAEGQVAVAWADKQAIATLWRQLAGMGLNIAGIVPHALAVPADDADPGTPLGLPINHRWQAPLPNWSLAVDEVRPGTQLGHWRRAAVWTLAAGLVWLLGLQIHAWQVRTEMRSLQQQAEQLVRQAFPAIPVIIDPVRQAQQQRDALRLGQGVAREDDFIPMATATSRVLEFADQHVRALQYEAGHLTLVLTEGYTPPANDTALQQAASAQSLLIEKDAVTPHVWHVRRADAILNPGDPR